MRENGRKGAEFVLVKRSEISAMSNDMGKLRRSRIVPYSGVGLSGTVAVDGLCLSL